MRAACMCGSCMLLRVITGCGRILQGVAMCESYYRVWPLYSYYRVLPYVRAITGCAHYCILQGVAIICNLQGVAVCGSLYRVWPPVTVKRGLTGS